MKNIELTRLNDGKLDFDEGDKRQYLPYILKWKCDKCGENMGRDLSEEYLSYPQLDTPFEMDLYCWECENETTVKVKLEIVYNFEIVEEK